MSTFQQQLHDVLFVGAITQGGDWGGAECASYVPFDVHVKESITIVAVSVTIMYMLDFRKVLSDLYRASEPHLAKHKSGPIQQLLEYLLAFVFFTTFVMLLMIKVKTQAVIMMMQPCHLLLIVQGVALISEGPLGILCTLFLLPPLTGALIALAIPTLNGLSNIEIITFWLQHYFLALVPLYLLCRRNFAAAKLCTTRILWIAIIAFAIVHFTVYEAIDVTFSVNPQFMICPTFALQGIFKTLPPYLLYPSYRTFVTLLFSPVAVLVSHIYWGASLLWMRLAESYAENSMKPQKEEILIEPKQLYTPIDGMRGLLSLWVVACHVAILFGFINALYPNEWRIDELEKSYWYTFAVGMGYQVDVFFMISGFLLSSSFIKLAKDPASVSFFRLPREILKHTMKRLLRFWPTFIGSCLLAIILQDYNAMNFNQNIQKSVFFLPIGPHLPITFGVSWSNRVDVECGVILIISIFCLILVNQLNVFGGLFVTALSILPKLSRFLDDPSVSYLRLGVTRETRISDRYVPVFMTPEKQKWLTNYFGPDWPAAHATKYALSPLKRLIMTTDYLIWHQRMTPFFVGLVLALWLHKYSNQRSLKIDAVWRALHGVFLFFATTIILFPLILGIRKNLKGISTEDAIVHIPEHVELIFNVFGRPLYSASAAYLLFRTLVPDSSDLHMKFLVNFLNNKQLQFMGKMSFGIYMTHFIVVVYFVVVVFPPHKAELYFGATLFYQFFILVICSYLVSLLVAVLIKNYVEDALQPFISRFFRLFERRIQKFV